MSYKPQTQPSRSACRWALRIILAAFIGTAVGIALTHTAYNLVGCP